MTEKKQYLLKGWKKINSASLLYMCYWPPQKLEEDHAYIIPIKKEKIKAFFLPVGFQSLYSNKVKGNALKTFYSKQNNFAHLSFFKEFEHLGICWTKKWYDGSILNEALKFPSSSLICLTLVKDLTRGASKL